jgi:hypothetical protein
MKKILSHRTLLAFFIFLISYFGFQSTGFSQIGDPGGDDDVPITGIEWLLLGGSVFGARKAYLSLRKRKSTET